MQDASCPVESSLASCGDQSTAARHVRECRRKIRRRVGGGVSRVSALRVHRRFQLLFSVTQVLFPMLAKVSDNRAEVSRLASRGARLENLHMCGVPLAAVVALPSSFLSFAYGKDVAMHGARTLHVLAIGQLARSR